MNRMKKHILFGGMLLCAAAFTSCNEDFKDWASPQSNEQGENAPAYGLTISAGSQANVVMDNAPETVQIISASASQSEIASFTLKSAIVGGAKLPYTYEDGKISVNSVQLDSLVEAVTLDRSATPHAVTVKTEWAAILATGEAVPVSAETEISLTPYSAIPEKDENGYVMLGDWQGWNRANATQLTEVEPGVFQTRIITTNGGDNWFKFYKKTPFVESAEPDWGVLDASVFGVAKNGDGSVQNLLVWPGDPRFEKVETPVISGAGEWLVTLDMNKLSFKIEPKDTKYYVVGEPNGWSDQDKVCMFYALGGGEYTYTTWWKNQWSLKIWHQDDFGNWDAAWGGVNGSTAATGDLVNSDAGAFGPSEDGAWATLTINMGTKKYEWTLIDAPTTEYEAISVIGGFNGWSDEGEIDLAQLEKAPHNCYARATLTADTELKFRANHKWDVNWGGDGSAEIDEEKYYVTPGGDNIKVPAGTYDFYLNDITGNWSIAKVAE